MNKKRVAINLTAQLMSFGVSMLLSFVLVRFIDERIPDSYGFTDIANRFVSAAQIGAEYNGQPFYYDSDSQG